MQSVLLPKTWGLRNFDFQFVGRSSTLMSRQYGVSSLQGRLAPHSRPSQRANCPLADLTAPRAIWHTLVTLFSLMHNSSTGPPLPRNFQWLVIAWRIQSKLLNFGIEGLLESDPNTYLSLDSVLVPSWSVTVLWTLSFASPSTYSKIFPFFFPLK